ncbi:hypothetical protein [Kineosporia babensis]|uniref:Uncharacterized protein n=1 Tax=Kineosporia babensis TaxID=499548 RepID=A0A9X1NCA9_9ACTN|nr:hypothetical protein [Kineosporia babensis]MCD5311134.1 hypothetical protein [Kineosporia babensis]
MTSSLPRRLLLQAGLAGAALTASACSSDESPQAQATTSPTTATAGVNVLLVYFPEPGRTTTTAAEGFSRSATPRSWPT